MRTNKMKFDVFDEFRNLMEQHEPDLKPNTRKKYLQSVKSILSDFYFDSPAEIPPLLIERGIKSLETKNDVSAAKRGFELFSKYFSDLRLPEHLEEISQTKRNLKKRQWTPLDLDKLQRKINSLKNDKLKYAYRLMLATGMRVSEVEQILKQNITIEEDKIEFFIPDTKNGEPATIGCQEPYLLAKLPQFLSDIEDSENVFYSAKTMMNKATSHGFECHDLRRGFSKIEYQKRKESYKEQGMNPRQAAYTAIGEVRELLRHRRCRTSMIYLRRKTI